MRSMRPPTAWRLTMLLLVAAPFAAAQTAEVPPKVAVYIACHGPQASPSLPGMPALAGQTARCLYRGHVAGVVGAVAYLEIAQLLVDVVEGLDRNAE